MTVPASPQSTSAGPPSGSGATSQPSPSSSMEVRSARSASTMSPVSRARSGPRIRLGPSARAAITAARLVNDFDPGSVTTASTGPCATGAGQRSSVTASVSRSARGECRGAVG